MSLVDNTKYRIFKDKFAQQTMLGLTLFSLLLAIIIGSSLFLKSLPILKEHSLWSLLTESNWRPMKGELL